MYTIDEFISDNPWKLTWLYNQACQVLHLLKEDERVRVEVRASVIYEKRDDMTVKYYAHPTSSASCSAIFLKRKGKVSQFIKQYGSGVDGSVIVHDIYQVLDLLDPEEEERDAAEYLESMKDLLG